MEKLDLEKIARHLDRLGRAKFGTTYMAFWRVLHFWYRTDLLLNADRQLEITEYMREHPERIALN